MNDATNTQRPAVIHDGISRRQLLALGASGLAGTLLSPRALAVAPAQEGAPPPGGPRLLLKGGSVLTLDRSPGAYHPFITPG